MNKIKKKYEYMVTVKKSQYQDVYIEYDKPEIDNKEALNLAWDSINEVDWYGEDSDSIIVFDVTRLP